jgi:threonine dehydrogenase-like Zn-dependent dehydrogenase
MKALYFDGLILHFIENYHKPEPDENQALVRVLLAGICATDVEITRGYKSFTGIPGHEFVGIVEEVNGAFQSLVGKKVVGEINIGCGTCEYCAQGLERHCNTRSTLGISERDGAFTEYLTLPLKNLWEVPEGVSDEEAVFTEPLAAAFEILEQVHIQPTHKTAILGDGKLGLLIAFVLQRTWSNLVLLGKYDEKMSIASRGGITIRKSVETIKRQFFDVVVEATGSQSGIEMALNLVKPRGTVVVKSTVAEKIEIDFSRVVIDELTLVGSRCGPFPPALKALANKSVDVKQLVSATYQFDQAFDAFEYAKNKNAIKVLLDFRHP